MVGEAPGGGPVRLSGGEHMTTTLGLATGGRWLGDSWGPRDLIGWKP
jgi:hypothetical protein